MADLYVAKNGNDSNPGTIASPKLTIGAAALAAAVGDTVHVSAGVYHESVYPGLNKRIHFVTDGHYVVMDGLGILSYAIQEANNGIDSTPYLVRGFVFRGYTGTVIYGSQCAISVDQCDISVAPNGYGVYAYRANPMVSNTIIRNAYYGVLAYSAQPNGSTAIIEKCTFYKCVVGINNEISGSVNGQITCRNSAFIIDGSVPHAGLNSCYAYRAFGAGQSAMVCDYNNFDRRNNGYVFRDTYNATDYVTLANWQGATIVGSHTKDPNSHEFVSSFLSEDDGLLLPNASTPSALINAGQPTGSPGKNKTIGAYGTPGNGAYGFVRTDAEWLGGTHINTEFEPITNKVRLQAGQTSGTFTTLVKNFATVQTLSLKRFLLAFAEANVAVPGAIETVDRVNTDQSREIEVSINGGGFVLLSYGVANSFADPTTMTSIQLRLTLRTNGNI